MLKPHYRKIAIIGNAGSGKTTLAFQLQEKLNLPVYHLDQYYWLPDWQRIDFAIFSEIHDSLIKKDTWIIEGSYHSLLPQRIIHADVVIFLDMPRYVCMWRVLKRSIIHYGKVTPGNPQGCKQQLFSAKFLEFLQWVWNFNKRRRQAIVDILDDFKQTKQIYICRSSQELTDLVKYLLLS